MGKYINDKRLTDEVIKDVLNKCGFELITSKQDDYIGETVTVSGIVRSEDNIIANCINKETQEFAGLLYRRFPMMAMLNTGAYSIGEEIITFDDFFAQRMKLNDEIDSLDKKLFDTYHSTMCSIFGEEYERDSKACFDEIMKKEAEKEESKTEEKAPELGE